MVRPGQAGGGLGISDATTGASTGAGGRCFSWADNDDISTGRINSAITNLDSAITTLRSQAKTLASNLSVITARQDFTSSMINTLEDGAADLVNANMEEESANMLMLPDTSVAGHQLFEHGFSKRHSRFCNCSSNDVLGSMRGSNPPQPN